MLELHNNQTIDIHVVDTLYTSTLKALPCSSEKPIGLVTTGTSAVRQFVKLLINTVIHRLHFQLWHGLGVSVMPHPLRTGVTSHPLFSVS